MISNAVMNKQTKLSQHLTSSSVAALGHSSKLDGSRLTPHFSLGELTKTRVNIENVPNEAQVNNLKRLCRWLEQLRLRYNQMRNEKGEMRNGNEEMRNEVREYPIIINSGFRSSAVNKAVGGVPTSNHLTGCAVDIRCIGMEQALRYAAILLDISDQSGEDFDELLIEQKGRVIWIHFAVRPSGNRRRTNFRR